jgi:exodeoxyribonuclease-3
VLIISWNVNGLRSVQRKGFFESIKNLNPDILCLQESRISEEHFAEPWTSLDGYTEFHSCAEKKGYSGVITYIKDSIASAQAPKLKLIRHPLFINEGRQVVLDFKDFVLYNLYFPSGTSSEERQEQKYVFLEHLHKHLKSLPKNQRSRVVICGDVNICHRELDIHHPKVAAQRELSGFLPEERAWIDLYIDLGFVDSYRVVNGDLDSKFTWWSYRAGSRKKNLGWRIDYFFVAEALKNRISGAEIHSDVEGSDHCPISLELDL